MLDWTRIDLAKASRVSLSTIQRIERSAPHSASDDNRVAIQSALEAAGIVFLSDEGDGAGVRLSLGSRF